MEALVSVLLPQTLEVLRAHRPLAPRFTLGTLEAWRSKYTRGPLELWPRADGSFAVFDRRRPWNDLVVAVTPTADAGERRLGELATSLPQRTERTSP